MLHTSGRFWTSGSLSHCVPCFVSLALNVPSDGTGSEHLDVPGDGRGNEHTTHVTGSGEKPAMPRLSGISLELQGKNR